MCFEKGHTVTVDDVDSILAHNREESAFTLFDAMAAAEHEPQTRLSESLSILQKLRNSKDSNYVSLIAGLTWFHRLQGLMPLQALSELFRMM